MATINGTSSDVSVFLRQAGGGFAQEAGSPISVGAGSGPSGAAVGDYNGDGLADLAVSTFVAGNVSVLLRQPGGGFALEGGAAIPLGSRISAVAAGDFNSDGRLDLAATRPPATRSWSCCATPRTPASPRSRRSRPGRRPVAIAVGDYNGDGLADLAIANRNGDSVTILLRVAGGTFSSEAAVPAGDDPIGIVAADFDGNGRADLAVTNAVPGTVSAFLRAAVQRRLHRGAAVLGQRLACRHRRRRLRPRRPARPRRGRERRRRRDPPPQRRPAASRATQSIPLAGAVNDVAAADFDGDSRPDLAASSYTSAAADTFTALLNPAPRRCRRRSPARPSTSSRCPAR